MIPDSWFGREIKLQHNVRELESLSHFERDEKSICREKSGSMSSSECVRFIRTFCLWARNPVCSSRGPAAVWLIEYRIAGGRMEGHTGRSGRWTRTVVLLQSQNPAGGWRQEERRLDEERGVRFKDVSTKRKGFCSSPRTSASVRGFDEPGLLARHTVCTYVSVAQSLPLLWHFPFIPVSADLLSKLR